MRTGTKKRRARKPKPTVKELVAAVISRGRPTAKTLSQEALLPFEENDPTVVLAEVRYCCKGACSVWEAKAVPPGTSIGDNVIPAREAAFMMTRRCKKRSVTNGTEDVSAVGSVESEGG